MREFFLPVPRPRLAAQAHSTQEINLSISKSTVAEHNKCSARSLAAMNALQSALLQVLLFPAFQCAVLADRTKEDDGPAGSMNPSNQP